MLSLSRKQVFEWYAKFRECRENVEYDERSGRPKAVRTPDMIETVQQLISTHSRMTLRMMKEVLEITREIIRKILMEDLGKRKICARSVPQYLPDEQISDCKLVKNLFHLWKTIVPCLTPL
jgi:hypothetical protein